MPSLVGDEATGATEIPSPVPDDLDPDILVLGFQELDLSTGALLYSYTTTMEDMWVEAIFAGLGEVREEYTKVRLS